MGLGWIKEFVGDFVSGTVSGGNLAFDFSFGLWRRSNEAGYTNGSQCALELAP